MRCKAVQERLDLYLAQELAAADQRQVEAHLRSCPDCRAESVRLRELAVLLRSDTAVPPVPEGFGNRVLARAKERVTARKPSQLGVPWRIRRWWTSVSFPRRAEAAAALAAGLLIGALMGQQTWRSVHTATPPEATQGDLLAVYELDYLSDAPAGSLTQAFLTLTRAPKGDGA